VRIGDFSVDSEAINILTSSNVGGGQ